jgi:hypothetical protein
MNRRQLIVASTAALFTGAAAPSDPTAADLKDDVQIVRRALALHPGLYRYSTPAEVLEHRALNATHIRRP